MRVLRGLDMGHQIGLFCAICCHKKGTSAGFCDEDIRSCGEADCPLWFFRFGKSPEEYIKDNGEGARDVFRRDP